MVRLLTCFLACLAIMPVSGQNVAFEFEHFGYEQGLTAAVLNMTKGKDGFLWMGSSDGLIRFDGKNFTTYRNSRSDTASLPNNIINDLFTDHKGNIWAATNGGLCYLRHSFRCFPKVSF